MIIVYTKDNCDFCERAKWFLKDRKVPCHAWNIEYSSEARQFLKARGHATVPQFYVDDTLLVEGGYEGLLQLTDEQIDHLRGV
jgi:glutaredoxin 3